VFVAELSPLSPAFARFMVQTYEKIPTFAPFRPVKLVFRAAKMAKIRFGSSFLFSENGLIAFLLIIKMLRKR